MLSASGFLNDVIFSHNEAHGPELKTTRMFRPVRRVAAPGAKSAVGDCILYRRHFTRISYIYDNDDDDIDDNNNNESKVIWQEAASLSCHPTRRQMQSSAACAGHHIRLL